MVKAVYNFNPKNAVGSRDDQGDCPPFPYPLSCGIVCNCYLDFRPVTKEVQSATWKYVLQNGHLTLADTHKFVDIVYSHLNPDGAAHQNDKSSRNRPKGGGSKKGGSTPTCGKYNSKKGCTYNPCKFCHVCHRCGGDHPQYRCTTETQ